MWIPMVVLVVLVGYAFSWLAVGAFVLVWITVSVLLPLTLRQ
jgi:hypothetical protein